MTTVNYALTIAQVVVLVWFIAVVDKYRDHRQTFRELEMKSERQFGYTQGMNAALRVCRP